MEELYPQAFFSAPGMLALFTVFLLIEVASLAFLWLASYEFRRMMRRHAAFVQAISDNGQYDRVERSAQITYWLYVLMTLTVTAVTALIFLFQPHIL